MDNQMDWKLLMQAITIIVCVGGLVWKLSEKITKVDAKLDAHIEGTKEWRELMLGMIKGKDKG